MELTQPLEDGLGLVVRINNQYSHPVCIGRCTDTYTTINNMWEISWENQLLTQECRCRYCEIFRNRILCGRHADDANNRVIVDDITWKSHKTIAQINHTNKLNKQIAEDKKTSRPRMKKMNKSFRCPRATQVHMEDLALVNLTEKRPSRRGEQFKAPC